MQTISFLPARSPQAVVAVLISAALSGCGGSGSVDKTPASGSGIVGRAVRTGDQKAVANTVVSARHYVCAPGETDNCSFAEEAGDAPRVTAGSDGNFVFPLAPGRYFVSLDAPKGDCTGYQSGDFVEVVENQQTTVSLPMSEVPTCAY